MSRSIHDESFDDEAEHDGTVGLTRSTKVAVVAVLLVLASVGGVLLYFSSGEGDVTSVLLTPPSRSGETLTFAYSISTTRSFAEGTGTFTVTHDGTDEFEGPVAVKGGGGRIDVKFSDFVVGNGEYLFRLVYKGQQATSNYTLGVKDFTDYIVTGVRADAVNNTWVDVRKGAISFTANFLSDPAKNLYARAPPDSTIEVRVLKNGVLDSSVSKLAGGLTFVHLTLNVTFGPGNYTVQLTFHNQWVKNGSAIKTLTDSNTTFVHNKPTACVSQPLYHGNNANSFNITADATCSTDDEGQVADYLWSFGDGTPTVSSAPSPLEPHQFPSSVSTRTYQCSLTVYDIRGEFDTAAFTVTTSAN